MSFHDYFPSCPEPSSGPLLIRVSSPVQHHFGLVQHLGKEFVSISRKLKDCPPHMKATPRPPWANSSLWRCCHTPGTFKTLIEDTEQGNLMVWNKSLRPLKTVKPSEVQNAERCHLGLTMMCLPYVVFCSWYFHLSFTGVWLEGHSFWRHLY